MKTPYCYAPWTTAQYSGTFGGGGISPCCEWNGEKFTGAVKDYYDSDYLKDIKTAMENNDMSVISKTCKECITTERHGSKSARNYIERDLNKNYYEVGVLNKLDYRPDNLCNLKCRMCSPGSSSLIEEEYLKYQRGITEPIEKRDTNDVIDFDLSNLKTLALLGGEPTVNNRLFPILDYLIDNKMNETTRLNYTTNCTSINEPWMSRARKFKYINVNLSIDAAGKAYEYIRTNAVWAKVRNNIPKIIEIAEDYNFQMVVQTTSFAIIEDWIEYFLDFDCKRINMTTMYGVAGRLDCIPDDIKKQKIKYLEKLNHPTADQAIKHFKMHKYNIEQVKLFKKRTEFLDRIRGTSIYDLDPIFEDILARV